MTSSWRGPNWLNLLFHFASRQHTTSSPSLSFHTTLQVDRIFRQLEMNSFLTHFTTLQSWHTRYIEASGLPHPLPKMSCKKICPIAQLHWAGSVSKSEWVSWVQLLSRNSMSVISCCYCALPTRYEESVYFSLPLSHVVAPRVKKVVWSLIFLKLSNQPRNLFRHSVGLSYVMVLCFIWASEVPCDMSWWISHFPPPPIPPE